MDISELEKKPHSEWTEEEKIYWLQKYAENELMKESAFEII